MLSQRVFFLQYNYGVEVVVTGRFIIITARASTILVLVFTIPETVTLTGGKLVVGLYNPTTLERLPIAPDQDAVLITAVDVQPFVVPA